MSKPTTFSSSFDIDPEKFADKYGCELHYKLRLTAHDADDILMFDQSLAVKPHIHIDVDARHACDPATVKALVRKPLTDLLPVVVQASVKAAAASALRCPGRA